MNKRLGFLLLLASAAIWGAGTVVTKMALVEIPPFSLAFLRAIISTAIVYILFFKKGHFKIEKKDRLLFIAAGLTGAVFNLTFFLTGVKLTTAISAQTIFTVNPILIAVLAGIFLKEKIKTIHYLGLIIGLTGALIVAMRDLFEIGKFNNGDMLGNLLIFCAAISWVFYILISKKLSLSGYSPITITCFSFLVSLFVFAPAALFENLQNTTWIHSFSFAGAFGVIYQGVFASVIAFLAYQTGLKLTSAFAAGIINYLNPIFTTLIAIPLLGEKISNPFLIGSALIIFGSVLATQFEMIKDHLKNGHRRIRKKIGY